MKYSFFGTPKFAEVILRKLIKNNMKPHVVVCNPDRPVGRDQVMTPPPTKVVAAEHDILVWQPEELDASKFDVLKTNDIFVVAAYSKIIPKKILEIPKQGAIGVHPSLLPKYRGATPIRSAILAGEEKTGASLYKMDEKMDHGPVITQREINIDDKDYLTLKQELAETGADLFVNNIQGYLEGELTPQEQNHDKATFTKKFSSDDAYVKPQDLTKAIEEGGEEVKKIYNMIRSLNPEPGVWTKLEKPYKGLPKEKRVKLLQSKIEEEKLVLTKIHVAGKTAREVNIHS